MQQHGQELPLVDRAIDLSSAAFCAGVNRNSSLRGFMPDMRKPAASSRNSTMPRFTSVCSVVRGTASSRMASTVRVCSGCTRR